MVYDFPPREVLLQPQEELRSTIELECTIKNYKSNINHN